MAAPRCPPEQPGIRPRGAGMLVSCAASSGSDARIAMGPVLRNVSPAAN
jgi:hypothetical protein